LEITALSPLFPESGAGGVALDVSGVALPLPDSTLGVASVSGFGVLFGLTGVAIKIAPYELNPAYYALVFQSVHRGLAAGRQQDDPKPYAHYCTRKVAVRNPNFLKYAGRYGEE
jgi:hypothetical protein